VKLLNVIMIGFLVTIILGSDFFKLHVFPLKNKMLDIYFFSMRIFLIDCCNVPGVAFTMLVKLQLLGGFVDLMNIFLKRIICIFH